MTVLGVDDTDSRAGQCTTYVAARIADRLARGATVHRCLLVRCNPAVEHKTRGNAALAIHTDAPPSDARRIARTLVRDLTEPGADAGVVVTPGPADAVPADVAGFARVAARGHHDLRTALRRCRRHDYEFERWNDGRGIVGALAAVGAWRAFEDWTAEHIAYRPPDRRGQPREIETVAVESAVPADSEMTWDTVDRGAGELLCAPRTPGPILYGIRGETPDAAREVARAIRAVTAEPIERSRTFHTNQGTDAHLRPGQIGSLEDGYAYRVDARVTEPPTTQEGGHVFFELGPPDDSPEDHPAIECVAFEPTKRFRETVRDLRVGDRLTVCGEVGDETLKLEKFALRERRETRRVVPSCPQCERTMESAGAGDGYRCRDCETTAPGKVTEAVERTLATGWYEVPPRARRHIAKPLLRGGFDAPVHVDR